jgi:hypothetical protein
MKTANELLREAFDALLRGDTAERDRCCALAVNALNFAERVRKGEEGMVGEPIIVPDQSGKKRL